MTHTARTRRLVFMTSLIIALLATACTSSAKKSTPKTAVPSLSSSTVVTGGSTAQVSIPKPGATNPFTGIGAVPTSPTIAVKIDDTAPGRPQVGIDKADIVYIEAAEGGLTRLAAIFGTNKPTVGYVRSTRPSDPDLLRQFGKITEAYSGGAHDSLPIVRASGITSWSNDAGAAYYSRVNRYQSSYINLVLDLKQVAKKVKTPRPRNIGLHWSTAPPAAGSAARPGAGSKGTDVRTTVGGTPVEFLWSAGLKKYVRYIDGVRQLAADGRPVATPNVIVQSCRIVAHPQDTDVNGNPSQFTYTIGKGAVSVFRIGKRFDGAWSRRTIDAGTTLTARNGKPLTLSPGGAWFVLVRTGTLTTGA